MELQINVITAKPPAGEVSVGTSVAPFAGWLDLMRILSEIFERAEQEGPVDGPLAPA